MQKDKYQAIFRILICGDLKTGKSQVLNRLAGDDFSQEYYSTIGFDFKICKFQLDENVPVKMQLWDTSGQEKYQLIRINNLFLSSRIKCYSKVECVILVYDVTSRESFENIEIYIEEKEEIEIKKNICVICGNKIDKYGERMISSEEGMKMADKFNAYFIEVSAKNRTNIKNLANLVSGVCMNNPDLHSKYG